MRRKLIVGNWKMNGSLGALAEMDAIAAAASRRADVDTGICPPFTLIAPAKERAPSLAIGAQDCHAKDKGAHTGCVSVPMIREAGATMVIVGHSERRADQHETDADVRAKAQAALAEGLLTIVCVGESESQREAGDAATVVTGQLAGSLPDDWRGGELTVAYEPIWAIGTGKVATPADVASMHAAIRAHLAARFGPRGDAIRILYGGSVKADNAAELLAVDDVDGALVGGASLTAAQFVPIIEAA
ncbi:triose-phosphate isomerase [Allosphingosinicella flava]|uniref:Triosephosphate isomerase n=1 Tax=Allosphingosinicella flava TaxID=2771430 RepID=A0A7T2GL51_9SPHN|nr:triose-phosphate isomerase [Sphingosinicella flava]QPQ55876.1 triose-phosphate isomerase [Sphingosinicella flava]